MNEDAHRNGLLPISTWIAALFFVSSWFASPITGMPSALRASTSARTGASNWEIWSLEISILSPDAEITPALPLNTIVPKPPLPSPGIVNFQPADRSTASKVSINCADSGSVFTYKSNGVSGKALSLVIIRSLCSLDKVRGVLSLTSSKLAFAASAIADAADLFALAMSARNPSALALASAVRASAVATRALDSAILLSNPFAVALEDSASTRASAISFSAALSSVSLNVCNSPSAFDTTASNTPSPTTPATTKIQPSLVSLRTQKIVRRFGSIRPVRGFKRCVASGRDSVSSRYNSDNYNSGREEKPPKIRITQPLEVALD